MKFTKSNKKGSALIMAIAVVTMLAIVGAMFLLMSRIEEGSTSSLEEFKSLDAAVDSVIATVATELKLDTPGVTANTEYYDYPGNNDKWLANLEPEPNGTNYGWQQISDIFKDSSTGQYYFDKHSIDSTNIQATIVKENEPIPTVSQYPDALADADGDGVADSKWVRLDNISSSTGRPIYAAIRVIDNGGMLNVNTAYKFDANSTNRDEIDGRRQTQIDLLALSGRDNTHSVTVKENRLIGDRTGTEPNDLESFYNNAVFRYVPQGKYTLYDISDELSFRYRYILNNTSFATRTDDLWTKCFKWGASWPVPDPCGITNTDDWFYVVNNSSSTDPDKYDYRHIATTYNVDRAIDPNGDAMFYIEDANDPQALYDKIKDLAYDASQEDEFAQLAVNTVDYGDNDCNVTILDIGAKKFKGWEKPYIYISELARNFDYAPPVIPGDPCEIHREYGIELHNWYNQGDNFGPATNNQYRLIIQNSGLNTNSDTIILSDEDFKERGGRFFVRIYEDDYFADGNDLKSAYTDLPWDGAEGVDPDIIFGWGPLEYPEGVNWAEYQFYIGDDEQKVKAANSVNHPGVIYEKIDTSLPIVSYDPNLVPGTKYYWKIVDVDVNGLIVDAKGKPVDGNAVVVESPVYDFTTWDTPPDDVNSTWDTNDPMFDTDTQIYLERLLPDGSWLRIDTVDTNQAGYKSLLDETYGSATGVRSIMRELNWGLMLKKYWNYYNDRHSLGNSGGHYFVNNSSLSALTDENWIPPHNWSSFFYNVGEIGLLFRVDAYAYNFQPATTERDVRIDLADPNVQQVFTYITRIRPNDVYHRIKGRININTAPYYILAQLPWVSQRRGADNLDSDELARAIVAYRDKISSPVNYTVRSTAISGELPSYVNSADIREEAGFDSIGELNYVIGAADDRYSMRYYALDNKDQPGFPDLSYHERSLVDGSPDDFEERNLIFARISDLVTVRSDVFTAYILVRLGEDGPQRRIIAILDRSEVTSAGGKVKIIAKYPVPDPR